MIGMIQGTLVEKDLPDVLVDVQGVGYEIQVPLNTVNVFGQVGDAVKLYTHFVVREDAQQLFGFADKTTRALFRSLIRVNGVGPKLAMAILSSIDVSTFVTAIEQDDSQALIRIPGVGKKTAERLVIEMRDRIKEWQQPALLSGMQGSSKPTPSSESNIEFAMQEAELALVSLGYKSAQATKVLKQVKPDAASTEDFIRLALKQFSMA